VRQAVYKVNPAYLGERSEQIFAPPPPDLQPYGVVPPILLWPAGFFSKILN